MQVYSVEEQPLPYLVMEYIDGETLQQKQIHHGPLEMAEVLHLGRQMASGLAAAHAMGLIHRDIKPGNVLIEQGAEQKVKITDFGLARAADDASLTRSGTISGTPMYMAPEQALGQTLDHRADLFSLGSVLYELASGRPPFRAANTIAVLRRVADDTPRPMPEVIPDIPDWLVAIVTKLHAKKPADRFQSAKEVADLLARCQSELQLNGQVTCVASSRPKSSPHAPREESRTSTDANLATDIAPSTMSTPRSAYFTRSVKATFAAVIGLAVIVGLIIKPWHNEPRKMAAPGRPSDTLSNAKKTAEGGHPTSPTPSAPASDPLDFNAERQAAEWVLKVGGTLSLADEQGKPIGLVEGKLPEGNFTVNGYLFNGQKDVNDQDWAVLAGCRRIQAFNTMNTPTMTDAAVRSLGLRLPLHSLNLDGTQISDEAMKIIAAVPTLTLLAIRGTPISDAGIAHLSNGPQLTELYLDSKLTAVGLAALAKSQCSLKQLQLGPTITAEAVPSLADHPTLSRLDLSAEHLSDANIPTLRSLPSLQLLIVRDSFDEDILAKIAQVTQLRELAIQVSPSARPEWFDKLQTMPSLWMVVLHGPGLSDASLNALSAMNSLRHLVIAQRSQISDEGVTTFRTKRPDVNLDIQGKLYFASSAIPFSVIQQLDETDPLPAWELPAGAPPPVVAPCEPTLATERQQQWAEFLKRPVIEELGIAALALSGKALVPRHG